jgi:nitroreductase
MSKDNAVIKAIVERRTVRKFSSKEIPTDLLKEVLDAANHAPSGFNLQPWHFVVVKDVNLRKLLSHVAMDQIQVAEAPVTVVLVADPFAWKTSYEKILILGEAQGAINENRKKLYRRSVNLLFQVGPFGLYGLIKKIAVAVRRFYRPTPGLPATFEQCVHYVRSQTMLAAATLMIAAKGAGLESCPMEGFDEPRLKKLLKIPRRMSIPVIISLGYPLEADNSTATVRLSLDDKCNVDLFDGEKLGKL